VLDFIDAGGGTRTRTDLSVQRILSPLCLPLSPPRLPVGMSKHKRGGRRRGAVPDVGARISSLGSKTLGLTKWLRGSLGFRALAGHASPAMNRKFPRLTNGPEPTMLRRADRDQAIQDQVGYLVFAELWMGTRDAVRGNQRDDVGVAAETGALLGNVVGYD
jgi:hypothetical protein